MDVGFLIPTQESNLNTNPIVLSQNIVMGLVENLLSLSVLEPGFHRDFKPKSNSGINVCETITHAESAGSGKNKSGWN